jgi:hypothetical protein
MENRNWKLGRALAIFAFLISIFALPAFGQNTTAVTGTILDPNGIPYNGATVTAVLSNPSSGTGYTIPSGAAYTGVILVPGAANSAGTFSMQLVQNGQLTPGSSTWAFTVCQVPGVTVPIGTGAQCFTVTGITISGSSQDISANLNAASLPLTQHFNVSRVYATLPAAGNSSISATTMATAPAIPAVGTTYRFHVYASETVVGTSCTGNPIIAVAVTWQDPNEASPAATTVATYTITTNGTLGRIVPVLTNPYIILRAKAGTVVQYSTTFTNGSGCSPQPTVQIYPTLEQM